MGRHTAGQPHVPVRQLALGFSELVRLFVEAVRNLSTERTDL